MIYEIVNEDINETVTENIMATRPVYPGTALRVGSSGSDVALMQSYLNAIKNGMFPSLSRLSVDGKYGQRTKNTVIQYQGLSGLTQDGIIGKNTWDSIVSDYENLAPVSPDTYPGSPLRPGDSGRQVVNMQTRLNNVSPVYTAINYQSADGKYGNNMTNAVRRFQGQFGLTADGIIGPLTWNRIVAVSKGVSDNNNTAVSSSYPGYVLNTGSQGDSVRFIQSYLNAVNSYTSSGWPTLTVDGIYGPGTAAAVREIQSVFGLPVTGITDYPTWYKISEIYVGVSRIAELV